MSVTIIRGDARNPEPAVSPEGRSGFPVWHCPQGCGQVNDMLNGACRACGANRPCEHWDGKAHCGDTPTHMYTNGPRCDPHSPAALRTSRETSPIRKEAA